MSDVSIAKEPTKNTYVVFGRVQPMFCGTGLIRRSISVEDEFTAKDDDEARWIVKAKYKHFHHPELVKRVPLEIEAPTAR